MIIVILRKKLKTGRLSQSTAVAGCITGKSYRVIEFQDTEVLSGELRLTYYSVFDHL